ncbi:MAG: thioredoxin family protein [Planctomycetota bacterium]
MMRTAIALSLITGLTLAQDQEKDLWMQNFEAAKAKAKAENKDLLVDFTGSDWCGWCIRLDNEVFSKEEFQQEAPKHFVLVKLDYPQDKSILTKEIIEQNKKLQQVYNIQGYPTILLMSHAGRVYGQMGYEQGGPAPYVEKLAEQKKAGAGFQAGFAAAQQKKGIDRAMALDDCLKALDEQVAASYHFDLMKEIVTIDADGKAGLKEKYAKKVEEVEQRRRIDEAGRELNELISEDMKAGKGEDALKKLDAAIANTKGPIHKQMALYFKGMVTMDVSGDAKAALALLEQAKAVAPKTPIAQQIDRVLPQLKAAAEKGDGGDEAGGEQTGGGK